METTPHEITVRTPAFRFGMDVPCVWYDNNTFLTFLFNGLNLVFPTGERLFVRSVWEHRDQVRDPALRTKIRYFAEQEGHHARAHEQFFECLRAQGFHFDRLLHAHEAYMRLVNKRPPGVRLAVTAALEHYTATLSMFVFENDYLRSTHPEMRKLLLWHCAEELEHREVAYDVLQEVRPSYLLRFYAFWASSISIWFWTFLGMRLFMKQSGTTWRTLLRDLMAERRRTGGKVGWPLIRSLFDFLKPNFHPSQGGPIEQHLERLTAEGL
jgi:uncharacterized protein